MNLEEDVDYFADGEDPFDDAYKESDEDIPSRVIDPDFHIEDDEEEDVPEDEDRPQPSRFYKGSVCPRSKESRNPGHDAHLDAKGTGYVCANCGKKRWSSAELEEITDKLLREDSNAELCRHCVEADAKFSSQPYSGPLLNPATAMMKSKPLPYGHETGHIEWQIQKNKAGDVMVDDAGEALYVAFPELMCDQGHRWYKGEGPRRNINGKDSILFASHIYNRKRREIQVKDGIPDPAYTMDRKGRPTQGMYNRAHPQGRKVNTDHARRTHGASFYR
jgi:hypothetical protein